MDNMANQQKLIKFNLVGDAFDVCSVLGQTPSHIEWVRNGSGVATVYVDMAIFDAFTDNTETPKFAWLLESKAIKPGPTKFIEDNQHYWARCFTAVFTHSKTLVSREFGCKWVPAQGTWVKNPKMHNKTKLLSMISSTKCMCQGHVTRLEWVDKLRHRLDLYGYGFNSIADKGMALNDYCFSVAIENARYKTYYTEKLLDCFATGTIPVYLGAPNIGDHFDADGIIPLVKGFEVSKKLYRSKLEHVRNNFEAVKKNMVLEDFIWTHYLRGWYNDRVRRGLIVDE